MKSVPRGRDTSELEVGNVSTHGFWLLVGDRERFLSFKDFPWFRDATIAQLTNVETAVATPSVLAGTGHRLVRRVARSSRPISTRQSNAT